jgi:hypothetical protein
MSRFYHSWLLALHLAVVTAVGASTRDLEAGVVRFLVGESGSAFHNDSYVLPLSAPADINHARKLIAMGPSAGAAIAVANIAKGGNGINRDYLATGAPAWSWHVTSFEGFADFTVEILDGWPTYVESDVDGWIANTGGQIGFWQYTVVAELPTGDYDADLDVDADDFLVWRAGFGGSVDLSADGSGNGLVDMADYILWRTNLGTSVTLPRGPTFNRVASAVPEPGVCAALTSTLASLASALRFLLRRLGSR